VILLVISEQGPVFSEIGNKTWPIWQDASSERHKKANLLTGEEENAAFWRWLNRSEEAGAGAGFAGYSPFLFVGDASSYDQSKMSNLLPKNLDLEAGGPR